jgi:hypothetical protein
MNTPLLLLLGAPLAMAAELCPQGTAVPQTGGAAAISWQSYARQFPKPKYCIGNRIANGAEHSPTPVEWPQAGIRQATLAGGLAVQFCCFDREEIAAGGVRYGDPPHSLAAPTHQPAEEGAAGHNEGYPDLIEEDARISSISIRGTLWDGERPLRVDLLLRCSASQFAKEYAYQFTTEDRSADKVRVEWDLLRDLRARMTPSVQVTPLARTFVFLSPAEPEEAESAIEIWSSNGKLAGRFRAPGFSAQKK